MRAAWVVLLLVPLLAGCGSKGGDGGFVTPDQGDDGRYIIELTADRAFEPDRAKVPTDALVVFRFDIEGCDVRSEQAGGPDSRTGQYHNGIYPRGGEFGWPAPSQEAEFDVYCSRYDDQGMTAVIRVG